MYFRNYRPRKAGLHNCLKTTVWEDLSTGDMENKLEHWFNLDQSTFVILSDQCEDTWVEEVTVRHMKILQTFSWQIVCWSQVFPY